MLMHIKRQHDSLLTHEPVVNNARCIGEESFDLKTLKFFFYYYESGTFSREDDAGNSKASNMFYDYAS